MATTPTGRLLTEAHRTAQAQVVADTLRDVVAVWQALDPAALDASFALYSRAMRAILDLRRAQSASTAAAYLRSFREAEGVAAELDIELAEVLALDHANAVLRITGPVAAKVAIRSGKPLDVAMQTALVQTLGSTARLVQGGGRDTINRTVLGDRAALGVARVSDGDPCAFCAMLASRGAVYKSQMTAGFEAHDHCGCHSEPVYHANAFLPGRGAEFRELWDSSTVGKSGPDAIAAFRAAFSGATQ